jgi:hypothetical protein
LFPIVNSFWAAKGKIRPRNHDHMIERAALPGAIFVDRAFAALA